MLWLIALAGLTLGFGWYGLAAWAALAAWHSHSDRRDWHRIATPEAWDAGRAKLRRAEWDTVRDVAMRALWQRTDRHLHAEDPR